MLPTQGTCAFRIIFTREIFAVTPLLPVRRVVICKYYLSKLHAYDNSRTKVTNVRVINRAAVRILRLNVRPERFQCTRRVQGFFQTSVTTSQHGVTSHKTCIYWNTVREDIQGDSKVDLLGSDKMVNVRKKNPMNTCQISNGYRDRAVWTSRPNSVRLLSVRLDDQRSLQKKGGYTKRIAH